jgi:putative ABC transport system permease protein
VIVNRRFAHEMFPGQDPLGKRFQSWRDEREQREIVGVVDDVRYFGVSDTSRPLVYVPHTQNTWSAMVLAVRTEGDPSGVMSAVRREVASMDKDLALADVATLRQITGASLARPRFQSLLLGLFAAMALALAAVGIYGVLSYTVSQRTHEIGVRMALGARQTDVLRAVLGGALGLVLIGILTGWAGALVLTRLLRGMLYEVSPTDPPTFLAVAVLLGVIAIGASLMPAWRAARVDPVVALREE